MKTLLVLVCLMASAKVFAWGATGHRIVGEIAEQHLTLRAKHFVRKHLGTERLSHAAVWGDEIKSDPEKSEEIAKRWWKDPNQKISISYWHFVSIPNNVTYEDSPKNPQGDLVWSLRKMDQVLRDKNESYLHKKEAIRLLAHYMGDVHQPLHAGIAEDRGGNYCWVKFFPEGSKNIVDPEPHQHDNFQNLHAVWDSELIDSSSLTFEDYAKKINRPSAIVLAENDRARERELDALTPRKLKAEFRDAIKRWQKASYIDMVNESIQLRKHAYPKNPVDGHEGNSFCFEGRSTQLPAANIPRISYGERDAFTRIIDYRLVQAGIRLAHALDQLAAGKSLIK